MKTAILGAGAVGCYYGGMLARAGRDVVLIGRPAHVEAINRDGRVTITARNEAMWIGGWEPAAGAPSR